MRLHIVVAAGLLLDRTPSGASRRLLGTLRAAVDQLEPGESITVLHRPGCLPDAAPAGVDWRAVELDARSSWRRVLGERRKLPRLLAELGADVVEIGALPVPPRLPCPVALTIHDLRDLHGLRRRRLPRAVSKHLLRASVRRARAVTVPSEATAHDLRTALGSAAPDAFVVPSGVDVRLELPAAEPNERPYFLHVGHLEPRKNLLMLLSAFAEVAARCTPATTPGLLLVGRDAGMGAALRERARLLEIEPLLVFRDDIGDERLARLYAGARAVLIPSLLEGFGQTALEALAFGAPTLVADRGALPEVVGDAAEVLPADDASAWSRAMEQALEGDHPDDPARREARRERARAFPWTETAALQLEVWRTAGDTAPDG